MKLIVEPEFIDAEIVVEKNCALNFDALQRRIHLAEEWGRRAGPAEI
jgi:ATP-dependent DNA ligase